MLSSRSKSPSLAESPKSLARTSMLQASLPVSATAKPTPPKKSALDGSALGSLDLVKSPLLISATKFVQTMTEAEFVDLISCLVAVTQGG